MASEKKSNTPKSSAPVSLNTNQHGFVQRLSSLHETIKNQHTINPVPKKSTSDLIEFRQIDTSARKNVTETETQVVTISVGGERYQTYISTLNFYPETLLGNEEKRKAFWNSRTGEYFFDRHRQCFNAILYYYQSQGRLRRPDSVPVDTFLEEIRFFELGAEIIEQVRKQENIKEIKKIRMPRALWRRYLWFYLEYAQHSLLGQIIFGISIVLTLLSCVALAVETLPNFKEKWSNLCQPRGNLSVNTTILKECSEFTSSPFFIIQSICVAYFTIEFILRLISTPSYLKFVSSIYNWIDLISIIPYYVFLIMESTGYQEPNTWVAFYGLRLLRLVRFMRVMRMYLVLEKLKSLRVLTTTIRESLCEFLVMFSIVILFAFILGSAVYFAEQRIDSAVYDSIPIGLYWGIITMTGVGYGDITPISVAGRILACFSALIGPAMMGMLISVLVDRYQRVYNRKLFISEPEIDRTDLKSINKDNEVIAVAPPHRLSVTKRLSLSTKPDTKNFELVLSNENQEEHAHINEHFATVIKSKLEEVILNINQKISLKLIDDENREHWSISSTQDTPAGVM